MQIEIFFTFLLKSDVKSIFFEHYDCNLLFSKILTEIDILQILILN